jgi:hypothetical protein
LPGNRRASFRCAAAGVLAAVVALGLLAACGGGGDDEAEAQSLDEQVGLDGNAVFERQAKAENLIQQCMARQGFEYVPVDPREQEAALTGARGLSKDDFEEQYGYGITTLYEQRLEQAASNPNTRIRNTLTESERIAYDRTLNGGDPTATFAVALDTGDFSHLGGCLREATEQVFGGADILATLETELAEVEERALNDPRMVEAIDEWSACMSDAGYDFEFPEDVDRVLQQQLEEIVGPPEARNPDFDREALLALQSEEVAMVRADIKCEEQHIADVEDKVLAEYEAEFREQHADFLNRVPPP